MGREKNEARGPGSLQLVWRRDKAGRRLKRKRMVMEERSFKADGRTRERWGSLAEAWGTARPLLEAPPEKGYGECGIQ